MLSASSSFRAPLVCVGLIVVAGRHVRGLRGPRAPVHRPGVPFRGRTTCRAAMAAHGTAEAAAFGAEPARHEATSALALGKRAIALPRGLLHCSIDPPARPMPEPAQKRWRNRAAGSEVARAARSQKRVRRQSRVAGQACGPPRPLRTALAGFPRIRLNHRPAHTSSTAGGVRDGTSGG
jgi:hypothetical protein